MVRAASAGANQPSTWRVTWSGIFPRQQRREPRPRRHDCGSGADVSPRGFYQHAITRRFDRGHTFVEAQFGAGIAGDPLQCRDGCLRPYESAIGLEYADKILRHAECRKPPHQALRFQNLMRHSVQPRCIQRTGDEFALRMAHFENPGHGQQPLTRPCLEIPPQRIGGAQ